MVFFCLWLRVWVWAILITVTFLVGFGSRGGLVAGLAFGFGF